MTNGSIIHRPPNDICSPSHLTLGFPPSSAPKGAHDYNLYREHTVVFYISHSNCLPTIDVSLRPSDSGSPAPEPFLSHSASLSHTTPPERPSPFLNPFKGYPPSLTLSHLSGPLPRFTQRKVDFRQPTSQFLRSGPQSPSAWFVYDLTWKSWGQWAAEAEHGRLACLCNLSEL